MASNYEVIGFMSNINSSTSKAAYDMREQEKAFHMEEFKALKAEVAEMLKSIQIMATYILTVSAGVYTWLWTHPPPLRNCTQIKLLKNQQVGFEGADR